MANTWCGYIDMLATRSIAQRNVQDLRDALSNFHGALDSSFDVFKTGECYAFSDGAFFKCGSFDDFVKFYRRVRNELFQQQLFFRCSLIKGDIHVIDRVDSTRRREAATSKDRKFFSMTFGGDAAQAYQKESEFKGVGCTVESSVSDDRSHPTLTTSFFIAQGSGGVRAIRMTDIKFEAEELDRPAKDPKRVKPGDWRVFEPIVESCQISISQSERTGAYYSTPLVTAIRSLDLTKVEFENNAWVDTPYVFEEMISGHAPRALRHMPGIHFVLLACFDHLFRQKKQMISNSVQQQVLAQLTKFPQCFRRLDSIPSFVISHAARSRLVKLYVEQEKEAERTRRAPKVLAAKRLAEAKAKSGAMGLVPSSKKKV